MVLTGDYMDHYNADVNWVASLIKEACANIRSSYGFYAVLGNHDTCKLITPLAEQGIKTLLNATTTISINQGNLTITGLDDLHRFYSPKALQALSQNIPKSKDSMQLVLAHSPEGCKLAAGRGYQLYLTGHTHGGQICFPGGHPIITGACESQHVKGKWRYQNLIGFTSPGVGTSGLTLRLFCPGEISIYNLKSRES